MEEKKKLSGRSFSHFRNIPQKISKALAMRSVGLTGMT